MGVVSVGRVVSFDAAKGWGAIATPGGAELPFHCTALADGSRTVEVGALVAFRTVPGHDGRWEAGDLVGADRI